jgi:hypothetical protein
MTAQEFIKWTQRYCEKIENPTKEQWDEISRVVNAAAKYPDLRLNSTFDNSIVGPEFGWPTC